MEAYLRLITFQVIKAHFKLFHIKRNYLKCKYTLQIFMQQGTAEINFPSKLHKDLLLSI